MEFLDFTGLQEYHNLLQINELSMPAGWETLTVDEWDYLLTGRLRHDRLFGLATVNDVKGALILPDEWSTPVGLSFTPKAPNYSVNVYNIEEMTLLENAGAIFIPAAGMRSCYSGISLYYVQTDAYVQSTSPHICFQFDESWAPAGGTHDHSASDGLSVRPATRTPYNSKCRYFSVSLTKRIYFLPGNVLYLPSTHLWRLAQHLWDYVGDSEYGTVYVNGVKCNNELISPTYTGWIDLFGYGVGDNPTKISSNEDDYSTFTDVAAQVGTLKDVIISKFSRESIGKNLCIDSNNKINAFFPGLPTNEIWYTAGREVVPANPDSIGLMSYSSFTNGEGIIGFEDVITNVGHEAFEQNEWLKSITFPANVETITDAVFANCNALTSVNFPKSLLEIGEHAFGQCTHLSHITFNTGLTSIGGIAFEECGLTEVIIPDSVVSIGFGAFQTQRTTNDVNTLRYIDIGSGISEIGDQAFGSNALVEKIICRTTIPPSIGEGTFNDVNKTTCILQVPASSVTAYQQALYWSEFTNIQPIVSEIETLVNEVYI